MRKGKIQSTVPVLYDSIDKKWGKIIIEMEVIENDHNFTVITQRYSDCDGIVTFIRSKEFTKSFEEINGLYKAIKPHIDQTLPYIERVQRERDMALLFYVRTDFIKDENGNVLEGVTLADLLPEQWEIATSYERFKAAKK